mmetsp:Transcript_50950/g.84625  ORF Transcript_50950/g.84625 Transcript_50950/m.84625 type:complete len:216 (-) Transcript_50950:302-949(-)
MRQFYMLQFLLYIGVTTQRAHNLNLFDMNRKCHQFNEHCALFNNEESITIRNEFQTPRIVSEILRRDRNLWTYLFDTLSIFFIEAPNILTLFRNVKFFDIVDAQRLLLLLLLHAAIRRIIWRRRSFCCCRRRPRFCSSRCLCLIADIQEIDETTEMHRFDLCEVREFRLTVPTIAAIHIVSRPSDNVFKVIGMTGFHLTLQHQIDTKALNGGWNK